MLFLSSWRRSLIRAAMAASGRWIPRLWPRNFEYAQCGSQCVRSHETSVLSSVSPIRFRKNTVIRGAATLATGPVWQILAGFAERISARVLPHFSDTSPDGISPACSLHNGYPFPAGSPLYNNFNPTIANGSGTGFFGQDFRPGAAGAQHPLQCRTPVPRPGSCRSSLQWRLCAWHHLPAPGNPEPAQLRNICQLRANLPDFQYHRAGEAVPAFVPLPYANYTGTRGASSAALPTVPGYRERELRQHGTSTYSGGQVTAKKDFSERPQFPGRLHAGKSR